MKKINAKSILLFILCSIAAMPLFAQTTKTYYVCSATSFTLKAGTSGSFTAYEWTEIGGSATGSTYDFTQTSPTLTTTENYVTKKYQLRVQNSDGCWSNPDTFIVNTLPPINVNITGLESVYCANEAISDVLTANVVTPTAAQLPSGVAANSFAWTGAGTSSVSTITATAAGTYTVTVSYSLPATIGGSKLSSCEGTASATISTTTPPSIPTVTLE